MKVKRLRILKILSNFLVFQAIFALIYLVLRNNWDGFNIVSYAAAFILTLLSTLLFILVFSLFYSKFDFDEINSLWLKFRTLVSDIHFRRRMWLLGLYKFITDLGCLLVILVTYDPRIVAFSLSINLIVNLLIWIEAEAFLARNYYIVEVSKYIYFMLNLLSVFSVYLLLATWINIYAMPTSIIAILTVVTSSLLAFLFVRFWDIRRVIALALSLLVGLGLTGWLWWQGQNYWLLGVGRISLLSWFIYLYLVMIVDLISVEGKKVKQAMVDLMVMGVLLFLLMTAIT